MRIQRADFQPFLLYNENHAIVAWFHKGFADEQKANKNSA